MNDIEEIYLPSRNQHQTVSKVSKHDWVPVTHNGLSTRFKVLISICAVIGIVVFLVALIVPTLANNKSTSSTSTTNSVMNTTTQTTSISITSTLTTTISISTTLASTASTSTSGSTSASTSTIITTFTSLTTLTSTTAASTSITTSAWTSTTLTSMSTASTSSITSFITSTLSAAISTISTTTTSTSTPTTTISTLSTTTFTTSTISTLSTTTFTTSTPTSLTSSTTTTTSTSTTTTTTTTTTSTSTTTTSTTSTSASTTTSTTSTSTSTTSTETSTTSTSTTSTTSTSTTTTTASCAPGFSATQSAKCVDILSNLYNCGSIGYVCSSDYTICSAGICKTTPTIQLSGATPIPAWVGVTTDDDIQQVSLPVNVTLYNYSTSSVTVSSNGLLCLGSCTDAYANQKLPTTSVGGPTAFIFWYDLAIYSGTTTQMVYYATSGTAPNRITGFEFYTTSSTYPSNYYHFQILFYENLPNIVKYVYFEISDGGSLATIGVQQSSSGPNITYSVNQAFAVAYNTTLLFDTNAGTYTRI
ncbi:unnamed protein product [Adineta steineri]|uniref:Uncharacterized protein n=1 Tax=Adineta steineri TaxID=433720 RepID=A0A814MQ79_9BILA|nr:unnamed protein product [Adineta steineri]CAF1081218.1 unnamed protein product [Adineta steineri]